jgi:hypothetical protein
MGRENSSVYIAATYGLNAEELGLDSLNSMV